MFTKVNSCVVLSVYDRCYRFIIIPVLFLEIFIRGFPCTFKSFFICSSFSLSPLNFSYYMTSFFRYCPYKSWLRPVLCWFHVDYDSLSSLLINICPSRSCFTIFSYQLWCMFRVWIDYIHIISQIFIHRLKYICYLSNSVSLLKSFLTYIIYSCCKPSFTQLSKEVPVIISSVIDWFIYCIVDVLYFLLRLLYFLPVFSRICYRSYCLALNIDVSLSVFIFCCFIGFTYVSIYRCSFSSSYFRISYDSISCNTLFISAVLIEANICNFRFSFKWNSYWATCCCHCVMVMYIFSNIAVNLECRVSFLAYYGSCIFYCSNMKIASFSYDKCTLLIYIGSASICPARVYASWCRHSRSAYPYVYTSAASCRCACIL